MNKIDREALVKRHNIHWKQPDGILPLGNGEFCFSVDAMGLQNLGGFTMAHWGWHSFPLPPGRSPDDIPPTGSFQSGQNKLPEVYPEDKNDLKTWMFDNPHRMKLGRISFCHQDGSPVGESDISEIDRQLDLWTGTHQSRFNIQGVPVAVKTVVHPDRDLVAVEVESTLLQEQMLGIAFTFEYPTLNDIKGRGPIQEDKGCHQSDTLHLSGQNLELKRTVDLEEYFVSLSCGDECHIRKEDEHLFLLFAEGANDVAFSCEFSQSPMDQDLPRPAETQSACDRSWPEYWRTGGAIDLSQSRDPRWKELERRVVLSQYHMRAQSSGSWPAAEIGLMGIDPWRGQFHMEMVWWHLAHYGLWNRWNMAEKALECYQKFVPSARALAKQLGYKGLMWPKSVGPEGRSAPWGFNNGLLWKQPHPIFFAELEYRLNSDKKILAKWAEVIDGTAELMADYPVWDDEKQVMSLTPCVPPSEIGQTRDGVFDIAYWHWGLNKAQEWRERLGRPRKPEWDEICSKLAPLPVANGVFARTGEMGHRLNSTRHSHPDQVGVYGMLPQMDCVDPEIAKKTVAHVYETWEWEGAWGWDFPWTAMAAARTGQQNLAIDVLLLDAAHKNQYDETGMNLGGPCYYLPGNGGLLYAIAMMAAGWDGCDPDLHAPGFPQDGSWTVKWEGLLPAI